jgi:deoxyribodipyrimidine photo-lyase
MDERTILVWFRNDLRIHDNEILLEATRKANKILPVFCFDPFYFQTTGFGTRKTGPLRARFLIESVADLRQSLKKLGGDLIIRIGHPADIIPELAFKYGVSEVYHHREVAAEETRISAEVEAALWKLKLNLKHFIGHTLYHKEDLPFPIKDIPDVFNTFRKKVERDSAIRNCFDSPDKISTPLIDDAGMLPCLNDLGLESLDTHEDGYFKGGEISGLAQMESYFKGADDISASGSCRVSGSSSALSPWISMGCLSPRQIYWEIKKEQVNKAMADKGAKLILELLWRDYFRFMFKKHGNQYFQVQGFNNVAPPVAENEVQRYEHWKNGQTGVPFVDASMKELNATGFISVTSRKSVASYLVKDLQVNWLRGAAYFEEQLVDYAPASNWGNWANVAGVGNDPREDKYYNAIKQGIGYDAKGDYIKKWLPALAEVPAKMVHAPFLLPLQDQKQCHVIIGEQYPIPEVIPQQKLASSKASLTS